MSLEQAIPVFQDLLPILTPVPAAASVPALAHNPQIILILCGLPGSGKSSFSESLAAANLAAEDVSTSPWIRASQDDAPSKKRQEVESMVRKALREGKNVVVDRVGFDSSQRAHFVRIASSPEFQNRNIVIWCLVLQVPQEVLKQRLLIRPFHPTITPEKALPVLSQMTRSFRPPLLSKSEGFDRVYTLYLREQPVDGVWTRDRLEGVLNRIEGEGYREDEVGKRMARETAGVVPVRNNNAHNRNQGPTPPWINHAIPRSGQQYEQASSWRSGPA